MNHKPYFQILLIIAVALTLAISGQSHATTASTALTITDLAWIAGDWESDPTGRSVSEEHWTRPAAGTMIGMSRTRVGERTVSYEFLRIEERGDSIYYIASPKGLCPATDFKLTRVSGQEAVFENSEHDFPKRIIYRKNSQGGLTAIVDGGEGTKSQTFEFRSIK